MNPRVWIFVFVLCIGASAGQLSYLSGLQGLRTYRPAKPAKDNPKTVRIALGEVVSLEGSRATLKSEDGKTYIIPAIPLGRYRDIQILDRQLVDYTRLPEQLDCQQFKAMNTWAIPPQLDYSHCLE